MNMRAVLIVVLIAFLLSTPAFAQQDLPNTIEGLIVMLYNASVRIVGLAAFLMLLYAGILRLMGRGSESNQVILDAVVGTILLLSAVVILNSINPDLTKQGQIFTPERFAPEGAILPIVVQ